MTSPPFAHSRHQKPVAVGAQPPSSPERERDRRYSPGSDRGIRDYRPGEPSSGSSGTLTAVSVPRMPAAYPHPAGEALRTEREGSGPPSWGPPQRHPSARSPSGSSLSSMRSHPYSRQQSTRVPSPLERDRERERDPLREYPRIQLPMPGSSSSYKYAQEPSGSVPPMSSLAIHGTEREEVRRRQSPVSSSRGLHLPPLLSLAQPGNSPLHPSYRDRPHSAGRSSRVHMRSPSPVSHSGRRSPTQYALRPSYTYEQYPTPTGHSPYEDTRHRRLSDQYIPPPPQPSRHQQYHEPPQHAFQPPHSHHLHRRHSPQEYREPPSPPLRALPPEYHAQRAPAHPSFYHPQGYFDVNDRSRSLSSVSMRDRRPEPVDVNAPGQNRRLAHLMSEQKRRESINTGFAALRTALPNSVPTDSKAIILRKAVSHISHLESLLRKAGINSSSSSAAPVLTPSSWDEDGDRVEGVEGDAGTEDDGDIEMDKGKWEDEEDDEEKQGRMSAGKGKVRQ